MITMNNEILYTLIYLPLILYITLYIPKLSRYSRLIVSGICIIQTILLFILIYSLRNNTYIDIWEIYHIHKWIPVIGLNYTVLFNNIIGVMLLLIFIVMLILISISNTLNNKYYQLLLLVNFLLVSIFTCGNLLLFYIFLELLIVPVYFLITYNGGEKIKKLGIRYVVYNLLSGFSFLLGAIFLYGILYNQHIPIQDIFDLKSLHNLIMIHQTFSDQYIYVFFAFAIAFMIKSPIWPFHGWYPLISEYSNSATVMLLSSLIDKVGPFAILTYIVTLFPNHIFHFNIYIECFAIISVIYFGLLAIKEQKIKTLIGYSSLSHFGLMVLGILSVNENGLSGAIFYMFVHGLSFIILFALAHGIFKMTNIRTRDKISGLRVKIPLFAGFLLVGSLINIGLPGFGNFIGELMIFVGVHDHNLVYILFIVPIILIEAIYILNLYKDIFAGKLIISNSNVILEDLKIKDRILFCLIICILITLGVYPNILLSIINYDVNKYYL